MGYNPDFQDIKKVMASAKMEFYVGQTSHTPFAEKTEATVEIMGKFNPLAPDDEQDWALLRLNDCLGSPDKYGHVALMPVDLEKIEGREGFFSAIGYPGDRSLQDGVWVDPRCTVSGNSIAGTSKLVWATDCHIIKGQSGGPLTAKGKKNKLYAFALAVSETIISTDVVQHYEVMNANNVLSVKAFYDQIKPYLTPTDPAASAK